MVTVVFYSTSTCGYCKPIKTMLDNIQATYASNPDILFTNLVVDTDPSAMDSAREWGINAVPTVLVIVNEQEQERIIGDITREKVVNVIEGNLQSDVLQEQPRGSESGSRPLLRDSSKSKDVRTGSDKDRDS